MIMERQDAAAVTAELAADQVVDLEAKDVRTVVHGNSIDVDLAVDYRKTFGREP
jgi:hypothetical protein